MHVPPKCLRVVARAPAASGAAAFDDPLNAQRSRKWKCRMMAIKTPNPTDKYVGARIRMRRLMLGMSQSALAQGLGLTFQQIQKYEKGINRVGASRLQQIAHILHVPVEFFFEGAPGATGAIPDAPDTPSLVHVSEFLATPDGLTLVAGFVKIRSAKLRRSVVELVSYLARSQDKWPPLGRGLTGGRRQNRGPGRLALPATACLYVRIAA